MIEIKKLVPVAAKISAGKSNLLNVLLNIKFLECKAGIATKFINILRYNPNIEKPIFYHLKINKNEKEDKYYFYKDLSREIYEGEEKIIEANKKINKKYENEKNINYEDLFYMTEINSEPFIKDKEYLAEHDLCDIPGLSEYQENQNNEKKIEKNAESEKENIIEIKDNELLKIELEAKKIGLYTEERKREIKKLDENIINEKPRKKVEKKEDFKKEDNMYFELLKNANKNKTYLTEIFKIIKNYIDGAIIILSQDNFRSKDNYEIITQLHHVIQKQITNFLVILNKMDLSRNPESDIEECKALFAHYFPEFKTFNITLNTFVPISVNKLKNELLMNKDFKSLIYFHFYNFMENVNNYRSKNRDIGDFSFLGHLKNIIRKIHPKKDKKAIENDVNELNKSSDASKINNEIISIIKDLINEFGDGENNFGFTEKDFINNINNNSNNKNINYHKNDDDSEEEEEKDDNNINDLNASFILKFFYKERISLTPYISEESNNLLNYFKNNKTNSIIQESVKEEQTEKALLNKSLITILGNITKEISKSKLDIQIIDNLNQYLQTTIEFLKIYNVIFIPFIGEIGSGKSTIINGIIGEDILPTGDNVCTKRGIVIRYLGKNEGETNIRKTYFREEYIEEKPYYYIDPDDYIIGKGSEKVREILNNINHKYNENEEDSFYYIRTKIKLFDDLGLDDSLKKMIYLIDLPGFGTRNKFQKDIYQKLMKLSTCFIFTIKNGVIKDNNNAEILKNIFDQTKEQKKVFTSKLFKSSLFILNNFSKQSTGDNNINQSKKQLLELIVGNNDEKDEYEKYINLCFFHANLYKNYYTNYNYFYNIKFTVKSEFKNYLTNNKKFIVFPEIINTRKYTSFSRFLISQIKTKNEKLFKDNENEIESNIINENNEQSDKNIKKDLEEIFSNLNINEKDLSKKINNISEMICYGQKNIIKINNLKKSNFGELKITINIQVGTLNNNMQDELEDQLNYLIEKLDLFFNQDFSKEKDLKSNELFSGEMEKINQKLFKIHSECQVKYIQIIKDFEIKINDSLTNKKENIKEYLGKFNYKEIIKKIDKEINDNLEELNKKIQEVLENMNSELNEINKKFITTIKTYSSMISVINLQSFKDYFSIKYAGKESDIAKEIFREIKISTLNLEKIYEEKGFIEWFKSAFSNIRYFKTSLDIIIKSFLKKKDYILYLLIEELTRYIEKTYRDFNRIYKMSTKMDKKMHQEKMKSFNILKVFYQEQKYKIDKAKEKLLNKES